MTRLSKSERRVRPNDQFDRFMPLTLGCGIARVLRTDQYLDESVDMADYHNEPFADALDSNFYLDEDDIEHYSGDLETTEAWPPHECNKWWDDELDKKSIKECREARFNRSTKVQRAKWLLRSILFNRVVVQTRTGRNVCVVSKSAYEAVMPKLFKFNGTGTLAVRQCLKPQTPAHRDQVAA